MAATSPKGSNNSAQGNALGKDAGPTRKPCKGGIADGGARYGEIPAHSVPDAESCGINSGNDTRAVDARRCAALTGLARWGSRTRGFAPG